MDGLLVYRQYLENIRLNINNLKLPELESKEFMGILNRVNQIEDLSYIDVILKNAGLNLSFIGNKDFLNKKVVLKSKLDKYFDTAVDMNSAMKSALSDYMSIFISNEDEIIQDIEEITGENGIPEVSLEYFPQSSVRYYSAQEVIEKNKSTLSALFGALDEMDKKLQKSEEIDKKRTEELGIVEEYFDEETSDEELVLEDKNIQELISEEIEENQNVENECESEFVEDTVSEKEMVSSFIKVETLDKKEKVDNEPFDYIDGDSTIDNNFVENKNTISFGEKETSGSIDTSFLEDDEEDDFEGDYATHLEESGREDIKEKDIIDDDSVYADIFDIEDKEDFEDEEIDDYEEIDDGFDKKLDRKDFNKFFDDNDMEDTTGVELEEDLIDEDDKYLHDTDPREQNVFEEATNYFLTGKSQSYSDDNLRKLYKSKERIVKAEGVSDADDGLAKMVLALSDGLMNLPHLTSGLFRKAKKNGKRMRETMIVEEDEEDE